jgi:hypothetical protein
VVLEVFFALGVELNAFSGETLADKVSRGHLASSGRAVNAPARALGDSQCQLKTFGS